MLLHELRRNGCAVVRRNGCAVVAPLTRSSIPSYIKFLHRPASNRFSVNISEFFTCYCLSHNSFSPSLVESTFGLLSILRCRQSHSTLFTVTSVPHYTLCTNCYSGIDDFYFSLLDCIGLFLRLQALPTQYYYLLLSPQVTASPRMYGLRCRIDTELVIQQGLCDIIIDRNRCKIENLNAGQPDSLLLFLFLVSADSCHPSSGKKSNGIGYGKGMGA
jgi:hypothetical protein